MTDYEIMPDDELVAAMSAIQAEHSRRTVLKLAQDNNVGLTAAYLTTIGREPGQPWTQPVGAHDSYPLGWEVTHDGKDWTNIIDHNVWTPGVSGGRENVADGYPAWVQPLGAHDSYPLGWKVTHDGKDWTSIVDHNVWMPGVYGWRENVEDGYPAWVQPTGAHDAYAKDAKATHKGRIWTSTAASNVWEPGVYGWTDIGPA